MCALSLWTGCFRDILISTQLRIEQHETKRERLLMVVWPLVLLLSGEEEGVRQMKTNGQEGGSPPIPSKTQGAIEEADTHNLKGQCS